MEKPEEGDPKAKADREKFESIIKVETRPVILKGSRGKGRTLVAPELKSPDELNPKWGPDPEDVKAAKKLAAKKAQSDPKPQA